MSCKVFSASARISASLGGGVAGRPDKAFAPCPAKPSALRLLLVERAHQIEPCREQPFRQRFRRARLLQFRIGAEEFEVLAIVEDAEEFLVLARAEQVGAEPRAAPHHLPELRLRAHLLEEDEVHDLRHVDAGVEHVDRDGDVRRLALLREVVDQRLRIGPGLMGDDPREMSGEIGIGRIEALPR